MKHSLYVNALRRGMFMYTIIDVYGVVIKQATVDYDTIVSMSQSGKYHRVHLMSCQKYVSPL